MSSSLTPAVHLPPEDGLLAAFQADGAVHVKKVRRRRVEHVRTLASKRIAPPQLQLHVTLLCHCHRPRVVACSACSHGTVSSSLFQGS